jgi:phosphoribosylglycinamide formyltransferase-1
MQNKGGSNGVNIAIMASGRGTNLQAIVDSVKQGFIDADVKLVIGDVEDAYCLKRAEKENIRTIFINPKKHPSQESFDKEVIKYLKQEDINLVVLAGFMRILSSYLVEKYKDRILNIHPALLPSFKGVQAIKDAFAYGVKITGVTVHFVTEKHDSGPIILQEPVKIKQDDTMESLEDRIHKVEHKLYPKAIKLYCENKLKIVGRKVKILITLLALYGVFSSLVGTVSAENFKIREYSSGLPSKLSADHKVEVSSISYEQSYRKSFFPDDAKNQRNLWAPLSEEEFEKKSKELTYSSAKATAEFFDSIYMPYVSRGLFNIIGAAYKVDKYQSKVKEEYGVDFEYRAGSDQIYFIYERKY